MFVSHLYVFGKKSKSFSHFLIGLFVFLALSCMNCLYILEINPSSVVHLLLSPILRVVFSPCLYSFAMKKLLSLIRTHLLAFVFISVTLGGGS